MCLTEDSDLGGAKGGAVYISGCALIHPLVVLLISIPYGHRVTGNLPNKTTNQSIEVLKCESLVLKLTLKNLELSSLSFNNIR